MAVEIEIEMNAKIRKDISAVAKNSGDDNISFIFDYDKLTLLGYTNSSFCICEETVPCGVRYNLEVQSGIILAVVQCDKIIFSIEKDKVQITGRDKDNNMKRQVQLKVNMDTTANYQAEQYSKLISGLTAGMTCSNIDTLSEFEKISKVADKAERGVIIANNQFYTCGVGFKFYSPTELNFNCLVLTDDLKSLLDFNKSGDTLFYERNGYIICKNSFDCYFGIRTAQPPQDIRTLDKILNAGAVVKFDMAIKDLKRSVKSIKTGKSETGLLTFLISSNTVVVSTKQAVYRQPLLFTNVEGDSKYNVAVDFTLFNKLIQTIEVNEVATVYVYNMYIAIITKGRNCLLLSRG